MRMKDCQTSHKLYSNQLLLLQATGIFWTTKGKFEGTLTILPRQANWPPLGLASIHNHLGVRHIQQFHVMQAWLPWLDADSGSEYNNYIWTLDSNHQSNYSRFSVSPKPILKKKTFLSVRKSFRRPRAHPRMSFPHWRALIKFLCLVSGFLKRFLALGRFLSFLSGSKRRSFTLSKFALSLLGTSRGVLTVIKFCCFSADPEADLVLASDVFRGKIDCLDSGLLKPPSPLHQLIFATLQQANVEKMVSGQCDPGNQQLIHLQFLQAILMWSISASSVASSCDLQEPWVLKLKSVRQKKQVKPSRRENSLYS